MHKLHCDGYYNECCHQGKVDIYHPRKLSFCDSDGIKLDVDCKHCTELKVRKAPIKKNGACFICDVIRI